MKKMLGISLFAVLAVAPMLANAAVTDAEPTHATTASDTNVAAAAPQYALQAAGSKDSYVATAGYVKGAYNAAIKAVNKVSADTTTALSGKQATISDLSTIRSGAAAGATALQESSISTGTDNGKITVGTKQVAVKGLGSAAYTASTAYDAAGAATGVKNTIEGKLDDGATGYDIDAKSLKVQGAAVLTSHQDISGKANTGLNNLTTTGKANVSAQGTYDASATYNTGTVGKAIQGKADKATTLSGYGITDAYTKTEADAAFDAAGAAAAVEGKLDDGATGYDIDAKSLKVQGTAVLTQHQSLSGRATTDLSNLTTTGKANVSAQGTYDASATYNTGTVGAAIKGKADKATTLSGYGITDAYTKTETGTQITNAIGNLDATKSQTAAAGNGNLALSITEENGKITAISGSVTHQDISGKANKEGVVATVNKATASKTGASLTVSGTPTGTVSSTFSSGSLSGAKVSVPSSASVATLTTWGDDTTTGTATVSLSNTDASVTGGTVSGTVTSSFTGTGITSGTATGNITGITVSVPGFYDNASDTTAETFN